MNSKGYKINTTMKIAATRSAQWSYPVVIAVVLLVFFLSPDSVDGTVPVVTTRPATAVNPHWRTDDCKHCHQMRLDKPLPIEPGQVDHICLGCHDGKQASAEAHPIGGAFQANDLVIPTGWPLWKGRLECLTCHDMKFACDHPNERASNPSLLRGRHVANRRAFCAECHPPGFFNKHNPHIMLEENGSIRERACLVCHRTVPDRAEAMPTGLNDLRAPVPVQCRSCHLSHVEYFEPGHTGTKVPPDMLAYMAAREQSEPTTRPSVELIEKMKSTHARPAGWVLGPDDTIICSTCHNPHEQGLFVPGNVLSNRMMKVLSTGKVVSPVRSNRLCLSCHNK